MEGSRPKSEEDFGTKSKVESASLTQTFEKLCPIYMSYGMSYDEFWYGSPYRAKFYREAKEISTKEKDTEFWMQGVYIYDALCRVSPILHAFSKSGTKPLPYVEMPYLSAKEEKEKQISKEQQLENERLIAQLHFKKWAEATARHFEEKEVSND